VDEPVGPELCAHQWRVRHEDDHSSRTPGTSSPVTLAAEFGVLSYRAPQEWAAWASEQLTRRSERTDASQ